MERVGDTEGLQKTSTVQKSTDIHRIYEGVRYEPRLNVGFEREGEDQINERVTRSVQIYYCSRGIDH